MIIDTHAHYDDETFSEDRDQLLLSMKDRGVELIVNASASVKGCMDAFKLAEKYDFVYAMAGVHPSETAELENGDGYQIIRRMAEHEKCVAIGEIGLDYYWEEPAREIQKKWFAMQLSLAKELRKPVNIHSRDAFSDTYDIMVAESAKDIGGIVHCFSYGKESAEKFLDMGFYLGIGGVITFKNGKKLKEVVEYVPLDRLVLETDAPYLSPEPNRGRRNDSTNLHYVAEAIAAIKGMTKEEVIDIMSRNARDIYRV